MSKKGGRGYGGRGRVFQGENNNQEAASRFAVSKGLTPATGGYLDVSPGNKPSPFLVSQLMEKMRLYIATICDTGIDNIFGGEGKEVGEYPVFSIPDAPLDESMKVEMKIWDSEYTIARNNAEKLKIEKNKVFGLIVGQLSGSRKTEIKRSEIGQKAFADSDPRQLVIAIYATHVTDSTVSSEQNLRNVTRVFVNFFQKEIESVTDCYNRFVATNSALEAAPISARNDPDEKMQDENQQAVMFICALRKCYQDFKRRIEREIKPWPDTLNVSFTLASY
jgi:hypothetical protein